MKRQLLQQGVGEEILRLVDYNAAPKEDIFLGKELWEKTIIAIAAGNNIVLSGNKSTGKNVLAQDLARLFGRPEYELSFHDSVDTHELVEDNGILTKCALEGAFGVLDEINMADSNSLAILHSVLDFRRTLDLKGGNRIKLHDSTRFIGTMNYGYYGTKELNEALVSRFQVINMPALTKDRIMEILYQKHSDISSEYAASIADFFLKLQYRAKYAEISTKSVDLRGLLDALKSVKLGLDLYSALQMGVVDKSFDEYEISVVENDMLYFFPHNVGKNKIFTGV